MLFSSATFLFFYLPAVLLLCLVLRGWLRIFFLLLTSLLFYAWGEPAAIWLMVLSILIAYTGGMLMERFPERRKAWLWLSAGILLAMLAYFKYAGMVVPGFRVALPIGISFYTFQAIAYAADVYRGDIRAEKDPVQFGTFISFYPQLIAGPIERYGDIRPQMDHIGLSLEGLSEGARLFTIGLSKKLLLANPMGQLWERLRLYPADNGILGNWLAIIAFAFQIYFDFSGYSDMARGLGRMIGVRFSINFNYPYTASSITDFWRRWHITLSSWFREYVYIPLGGNRKGLARQMLNILIVWALTGLWHGAHWNFVLWGLYYAALLMAEKLFLLRWYAALPAMAAWFPRALTLFFVLVGWAIFALTDFAAMGHLLRGMFSGALLGAQTGAYWRAYIPLLVFCAIASIRWKPRLPAWAENLVLAGLFALCVAALATQGFNPFLYFRF